MADHSVDTSLITDLQGATANDQDVVDTMIGEIVTKHNSALHATTGHNHDGTTGNGPAFSSSVGAMTYAELSRVMLAGGYI